MEECFDECNVQHAIWDDECLLANSADVITQLQYHIIGNLTRNEDYELIAFHHKLSIEEVVNQIKTIEHSLKLSSQMLKSGDKNYVYDCSQF